MSRVRTIRRMYESESLNILDRRFPENIPRYMLQAGLAAAAVAGILCTFDAATQMGLVAGLGASAFIAFTMPHTRAAMPRSMIGGYLICITVGIIFHQLAETPGMIRLLQLHDAAWVVLVAIGLGAGMLGMVGTNSEHAPAAGIALGMMLNPWTYLTVAYVLLGVAILSLLRGLLAPFLKDLCPPFSPRVQPERTTNDSGHRPAPTPPDVATRSPAEVALSRGSNP